jgi:hypothetical protein
MKFRAYILTLLLLSPAAPLVAEERETFDRKQQPEVQKNKASDTQKYIFREYPVDLKTAARRDEVQPGNLLTQPASTRNQEYKPLNPIVISW